MGRNGKYTPRNQRPNLRTMEIGMYAYYTRKLKASRFTDRRIHPCRRPGIVGFLRFLLVVAYIALAGLAGAWFPGVVDTLVASSDTVRNMRAKDVYTEAAPMKDPTQQGIDRMIPTEQPPDRLEVCSNEVIVPPEGPRIRQRKETISMESVGVEILGDRGYERAKESAAIANGTVSGLVEKHRAMRSLRENVTTLDETITKMGLAVDVDDYRLLPGGHWIPTSCRPRWKVAIVVPFRNRFENLPVFLRHIIPFLKRQQLEFSIFITEQRNDLNFNRAMLMNVGFVEALNFTNFDCVIFHDVDHIALNVKNYFGCENMPRHYISGEVMWGYTIISDALFGGVTGVTTSQFREINGLPNVYWGWGAEDDEFLGRVQAKGYTKSRPVGDIGYFDTIDHQREKTAMANPARFCLLQNQNERREGDGLSNLAYDPPLIELHPLYTFISVNIQQLPWNPTWNQCQ